MVVNVAGSIREISGTTALLMIRSLRLILRSAITANCETSADVPAVVGMHMVGGIGGHTLSTPTRVRRPPGFAESRPMHFAQSMTLPPPTAIMTSQPCLAYTVAPAVTSSKRGLGVT